jgi:predicted ABC-type ATPase
MHRPVLFIVAGPNGSGKSMFSATLTEIEGDVFDGDKHLVLLKKSFPEIGSDVLLDNVNDTLFVEAKQNALNNLNSFAFETNFDHEDPTFSMRQFKDVGYETHLIFIGMPNVQECIQRVSLRVKSGGHKVSEDAIIHNFKTGYKNLYKHYHEFDNVTLLDNPIAFDIPIQIPVKLLTLKNGSLITENLTMPDWAKKLIILISK